MVFWPGFGDVFLVIYLAFCIVLAQRHINRAPNETRTDLTRFVSLDFQPLHYQGQPRWSVYILESQSILCVSFPKTESGLWMYYLEAWSHFNFLLNSVVPSNHSYLVRNSVWAILLDSFIMWLTFTLLLQHNLKLLFCSVLSIFILDCLYIT